MKTTKKIFALLTICLFALYAHITESVAATINAASASQAAVSAAINTATYGDTVNVPAGSATWTDDGQSECYNRASAICIKKGITLKGGVGGGTTNITIAGTNTYGAIIYYPDATSRSTDALFDISGFTFDAGGRGYGEGIIGVRNEGTTALTKIKIHNNTFKNNDGRCVVVNGPVYGVMYSNTFTDNDIIFSAYGYDKVGWTVATAEGINYGTNNNFFVEDNIVNYTRDFAGGSGQTTWGQGAPGVVFRYNDYNLANTTAEELHDIHGLQSMEHAGGGECQSNPPCDPTRASCQQYATVKSEVYGNIYTNVSGAYQWMGHRGAQLLMFNNLLSGGSSGDNSIDLNQYACDSCQYYTPPSFTQHITKSYFWNNTANSSRINAAVGLDMCASATGTPYAITANTDFWNYNTNTLNGSTQKGINCGSAAPTGNCSVGDGYWQTAYSPCSTPPTTLADMRTYTQAGTFWKCKTANTWSIDFKPYYYPHPLTWDDADSTIIKRDSYVADTLTRYAFNASTVKYVGSSFIATATYDLQYLKVKASKATTATSGNVTAYIYSDSSNLPGTLLATGNSINADQFPLSGNIDALVWEFYPKVRINSGTTYHIVLYKANYSTANYVILSYGPLTERYMSAAGDDKVFASTVINSQVAFKTYGTAITGSTIASTVPTTIPTTAPTTAPTTTIEPLTPPAALHYVDINSSYGGTGLSTATTGIDRAFKTLHEVNIHPLVAGDTVLLHGGQTWTEQLIIKDIAGAAGNVITFGKYGSGVDPVIDGGGGMTNEGLLTTHGIYLANCSWIAIENITSQRWFNNVACLPLWDNTLGHAVDTGGMHNITFTNVNSLNSASNGFLFYASANTTKKIEAITLTSCTSSGALASHGFKGGVSYYPDTSDPRTSILACDGGVDNGKECEDDGDCTGVSCVDICARTPVHTTIANWCVGGSNDGKLCTTYDTNATTGCPDGTCARGTDLACKVSDGVSHITFNNCTAANNKYHGFQFSNGTADITFNDCTAYGQNLSSAVDASGFRLGDTKNGTIHGCDSYDNTVGITVSGDDATPTGILIEESKSHNNNSYGLIYSPALNGFVMEIEDGVQTVLGSGGAYPTVGSTITQAVTGATAVLAGLGDSQVVNGVYLCVGGAENGAICNTTANPTCTDGSCVIMGTITGAPEKFCDTDGWQCWGAATGNTQCPTNGICTSTYYSVCDGGTNDGVPCTGTTSNTNCTTGGGTCISEGNARNVLYLAFVKGFFNQTDTITIVGPTGSPAKEWTAKPYTAVGPPRGLGLAQGTNGLFSGAGMPSDIIIRNNKFYNNTKDGVRFNSSGTYPSDRARFESPARIELYNNSIYNNGRAGITDYGNHGQAIDGTIPATNPVYALVDPQIAPATYGSRTGYYKTLIYNNTIVNCPSSLEATPTYYGFQHHAGVINATEFKNNIVYSSVGNKLMYLTVNGDNLTTKRNLVFDYNSYYSTRVSDEWFSKYPYSSVLSCVGGTDDGEDCTTGATCESGVCSKICQGGADDGEACTVDGDCDSDNCANISHLNLTQWRVKLGGGGATDDHSSVNGDPKIFRTNDPRLTVDSTVVIDTGTSGTGIPATDILGEDRGEDKGGSTPWYDIGAYEYYTDPVVHHTFYVDPLNGSDSWNGAFATHGTGDDGPWKTIQQAAFSVLEGETVFLMDTAPYHITAAVRFFNSGTAASPINYLPYVEPNPAIHAGHIAGATHAPVIDASEPTQNIVWTQYTDTPDTGHIWSWKPDILKRGGQLYYRSLFSNSAAEPSVIRTRQYDYMRELYGTTYTLANLSTYLVADDDLLSLDNGQMYIHSTTNPNLLHWKFSMSSSCFDIAEANYINFKGITFQYGFEGVKGGLTSGIRNVSFEDCVFRWNHDCGSYIGGEYDSESSYISYTNCFGYQNGSHGFKIANEHGAVTGYSEPYADYITFTGCTAWGNGWHGFQSSNAAGHATMTKCTAYENCQDTSNGDNYSDCSGFRLGSTDTGEISFCKSYDNKSPTALGNGRGITIATSSGEPYASFDITVKYNECYGNGAAGIVLDSLTATSNYVFGNVIHDNGNVANTAYPGFGIRFISSTSQNVYNNTLYNNLVEMRLGLGSTGNVIKNNIAYATAGTDNYALWFGGTDAVTEDYNNWHKNGSTTPIYYDSAATSLADYVTATDDGDNSKDIVPSFASTVSGSEQLWIATNSTLVDDGTALAESANLLTYESTFGIDSNETVEEVTDVPMGAYIPHGLQITTRAISGIAKPVLGYTQDNSATDPVAGDYTIGTVTWQPSHESYRSNTIYTARFRLTAATGYTLNGTTADWFTEADATSVTNSENAEGDIVVVFPATASPTVYTIDIMDIIGITPPVKGATPVSDGTDSTQYTIEAVTWSPTVSSTFLPGTVYTATITISPISATYTLTGVAENSFIVAGATTTNAASSGVITAVFPMTEAEVTADHFVDNLDGTVTDSWTGYVWTKNASIDKDAFSLAIAFCNGLASGRYGLTDSSVKQQWRMPRPSELTTLNFSSDTTLWEKPSLPFTGVMDDWYWADSSQGDLAFSLNMATGEQQMRSKFWEFYVWPVRNQ